MYDKVCYKRTFLTSVIARIDFPEPIVQLREALPARIVKTALGCFPIQEPRKMLAQEFEIRPTDFSRTTSEEIEWNFFSKDRSRRLAISPSNVFVTSSLYRTYEDFVSDFQAVVNEVFSLGGDVVGRRLGLRYVNQIDLPVKDPLDWSLYIKKRLLGLYTEYGGKYTLSRVFHNIQFLFDDMSLRFQFGTPNPDFPSAIRKPLFVVDLDAYYEGPQEPVDIEPRFRNAHQEIQRLFESVITDKLRDHMNAELT